MLERTNEKDTKITDNNNFYTSTPHKYINGNISDVSLNATNGNYSLNKADDSPLRNYTKEQLMNTINANTTNTNGTNTTTIIAEIEGEVKKKARHLVDKTYYIAKEILMTELTYKKDLDVINVVSICFSDQTNLVLVLKYFGRVVG